MTRPLVRAGMALLTVSLLLGTAPGEVSHAQGTRLTKLDMGILDRASAIAAQSPRRAVAWLSGHTTGSKALIGRDGTTILVWLNDGAQIAIVGRRPVHLQLHAARSVTRHFRDSTVIQPGSDTNRAIVLEPFADELALGPNAGQAEADALSSAGFAVDVKRNGAVTVPVMESLNNYSAVYMETHSGLLPSGDAIVTLGETDSRPYSALAPAQFGGDGSLMQALVAGDPTHTLYLSITTAFVKLHIGQFPNHSIVFLNGCSLLRAPLFWKALQDHGVGAMISWDQEAVVNVTEPAAAIVVQRLAGGSSVASSVRWAYDAGFGVIQTVPAAHLGFLGIGEDTLDNARQPATSTPATPTATSIVKVAPTSVATAKPHKVKKPKAKPKLKKCSRYYHRVHSKCVKIPTRKRKHR